MILIISNHYIRSSYLLWLLGKHYKLVYIRPTCINVTMVNSVSVFSTTNKYTLKVGLRLVSIDPVPAFQELRFWSHLFSIRFKSFDATFKPLNLAITLRQIGTRSRRTWDSTSCTSSIIYRLLTYRLWFQTTQFYKNNDDDKYSDLATVKVNNLNAYVLRYFVECINYLWVQSNSLADCLVVVDATVLMQHYLSAQHPTSSAAGGNIFSVCRLMFVQQESSCLLFISADFRNCVLFVGLLSPHISSLIYLYTRIKP
jgi:hypothetical protein